LTISVSSALVAVFGSKSGLLPTGGNNVVMSRIPEAQLSPRAGKRRQQPKPGVSKPVTAKPDNARQKSQMMRDRKSA
jgi:hypothetical protein